MDNFEENKENQTNEQQSQPQEPFTEPNISPNQQQSQQPPFNQKMPPSKVANIDENDPNDFYNIMQDRNDTLKIVLIVLLCIIGIPLLLVGLCITLLVW